MVAPVITFATNELTIMVPAGNPARVATLADLARRGLALAMPNPEFEGVARQIRASLVRAGGEALAEQVYGEKVKDGETMLTRIHHRQEEIGNPIGHVDIPPEVNTLANYSAAMVAGARHPQAAASGVARFRPVGVERPPAKVHPVGAERPPAKVAPRRKLFITNDRNLEGDPRPAN